MAADQLGHGVRDGVSTERDRAAEQGGKGVVDHQVRPALVRELGQPLDIGQPDQWVREGLGEDQPRAWG